MKTVKYFIALLFILSVQKIWAQDAGSMAFPDFLPAAHPAETAVPDAMPVQPAPQQPLAEAEEMTMQPLPASSTHVAHVAESRNQVVLLVGDSMADGLGVRFNDYAVRTVLNFILSYGMEVRRATGRLLPTSNTRLNGFILPT